MNFKEKSDFGLHGEHLVFELLRNQEGLTARMNTGPGWPLGYGQRFHDGNSSFVIPDIEYHRGGMWNQDTGFAEVKTKSAFACLELAQNELRTGIDYATWRDYEWFHFNQGPREFWMCFVHPLAVAQLADKKFIELEANQCGIFRQRLDLLHADKILGYGNGMVYWRISALKCWRTSEQLLNERSTRDLWAKLIAESKQRLGL